MLLNTFPRGAGPRPRVGHEPCASFLRAAAEESKRAFFVRSLVDLHALFQIQHVWGEPRLTMLVLHLPNVVNLMSPLFFPFLDEVLLRKKRDMSYKGGTSK